MDSPKRPPIDPDYMLDCGQTLEAELDRIIAQALDAGWHITAVFEAVRSLADNLEQADIERAMTDRAIAKAHGRQKH